MSELAKAYSKEFQTAVTDALIRAQKDGAPCILIWRRQGYLDVRVKIDLTPAIVGPTTMIFEDRP